MNANIVWNRNIVLPKKTDVVKNRLKFTQTGRVPNYALAMALGVVVLALVALGRT